MSVFLISSSALKKKLLFLIGKIRHGIGKKGGYFRLGMVAEIGPLEMGRKSHDYITIPKNILYILICNFLLLSQY